jgi:peptide/nickel transport system substrate-binding protein
VAGSAGLVACQPEEPADQPSHSPQPSLGGVIGVGLAEDIGPLDPTVASTRGAAEILPHFCESLYAEDAEGQIVPRLATREPQVDSRQDVTWVEIELRTDAHFADGSSFDAAAVKATLERYLSFPGSPRAAALAGVSEIRVLEDDVVALLLPGQSYDLEDDFAQRLTGFAGAVLAPAQVATAGDQAIPRPICVAPFQIDRSEADGSVVLVRDPSYYGADQVNLDGLVYRSYDDAERRDQALIAGEIDLAVHLLPQDLTVLNQQPGIEVDRAPGRELLNLTINLVHPESPLADSGELRRAFLAAISRDGVNRTVYGSQFATACSFVPSRSSAATELTRTCRSDDLLQAQALVAASGWTPPIRLSLTVAQTPDQIQAGQVIRQLVAGAGFDLEVIEATPLEQATLGLSGDFMVLLQRYDQSDDPAQIFRQLYLAGGSANLGGLNDPVLADLAEPLGQASDGRRQGRVLDQVVTRLDELAPGMTLVWIDRLTAQRDDVTGVVLGPTGGAILTGAARLI